MTWHELSQGKIWLHDNFLSDDELKVVLDEWEKFKSFRTIEQDPDEYYVSPIYYHSKQPKRPPRNKNEIAKGVIKKLNLLYKEVFGEEAPTENLTYAHFYFKENEAGVSRFDLHCEPGPDSENSFGHCVFLLYMSDEVDGPLVCPSEEDAASLIDQAYLDSVENMTIDYVLQTVSIIPKMNRCVVVKNGTPHYVPVGTGRRRVISGWSFLDEKLRHIS